MILKDTLIKVVKSQKSELQLHDLGIGRDIKKGLDLKSNHTIIISGVRRCGKSTLMKQLIKKLGSVPYFNLEDQRLTSFELSDFEKLDGIFSEIYEKTKYCFLDEVQNIDGWERYVRAKQDSGIKFFITGSNASMLSKELGTKLTGRYLSYELFPFSFNEFLEFIKAKPSKDSFEKYLNEGGFPEYLRFKNPDILRQTFNDILLKDIVVRYKLKDVKILKEIALYLISNSGKEFSYNKLKELFALGSTNTVSSYVHYLEETYLLFSINKFDYSYKKQLVNPKKVYCIDTGFAKANSITFTKDLGRRLENAVFLNLRRRNKEIFYYKDKFECDFLIKSDEKINEAIQVCFSLNEENKDRELNGLKEAMTKFGLKKGKIITLDQEDTLGEIEIIPVWKWILEK